MTHKEDNPKSRLVSRRNVLTMAGIVGAGAVASRFGGLTSSAAAMGSGQPPTWPWPYVKLDPTETAEIAYNEWYRVFCGAAVISSVFGQLATKVGEPYASFPIDGFLFLEGGVSGWGTICGSNAGSNIVTNLIIGPRTSGTADGMLMGSELMEWYCMANLPEYVPRDPRVKTEIIRTRSDSPLCHISVGKWMKAADKPLGSPERKDRCARVTATMAYQVVELLNEWKDGEYETIGEAPSASYGIPAQYNCDECHGDDVPSPPLGSGTKES